MPILRTRLFLITLLVALLMASQSFSVEIVFQVNMTQQVALGLFEPANDFVDLAGSFNDWGYNQLTPLSDANGDTIYSIVLDGFTPLETIEYKFRINGQWDGTEEFPGVGNNRIYVVQESDNFIDVWFNDVVPGDSHGGTGELHWWNDTVFYEVMVRSFYDSDGDGIGDLVGLTQKLDYLNDGNPATDTDLGITGIWLMPINDSPSYHGYDATDYRAINPDYGTMEDFENFLAAAHERGIKVIIDYVMNHCSTQHPWFQAAQQNDPLYRDYFRWSPSDPGEIGPWGQDVWHWNNSGWYYGIFWSGMPDLNYDTAALKETMFDTAGWWLDTVGVDGFRLDAVLYIDEDGSNHQSTPATMQFWQEFNSHVKSVNPEVLSVGEAWTGSNTVVEYVKEDRLDLCFEFDLSYATMGAVNYSDTDYLGNKADQVYLLYPYLQFATFLTNHDQDRALNVLGFDEAKAKVAAGIYLTLPGVPFVYYGEEIGMIGSGAHEFIRSPMQWNDGLNAGFSTGSPWQEINANHEQFNVESESLYQDSLLSWYRKLIRLRNEAPALRRGTHKSLASSSSSVLGFVRETEQQTLLCVANTSEAYAGSITLSGWQNNVEPGEYSLVDLLDPQYTATFTVTDNNEISELSITGNSVRVFEFPKLSPVVPLDLPDFGLRLNQNHPNPFNPSTAIEYYLPTTGKVEISIYDVSGKEIIVLVDELQDKGDHIVRWHGENSQNQEMGAGVYFVMLTACGNKRISKMTLLK